MDSTNARMIDVWDGEIGQRWVREQARYESMNVSFASALLAAAAIRPGEAVLDIGCGPGARSLDAASAAGSEGRVLGVDVSTPMLDVARTRAQELGLRNVAFVRADAQSGDLGGGEFDVAISQFGVMFFEDLEAAFRNLRRALRPAGGRIAFVCWQDVSHQDRITVPLAAALEHVPVPAFDADDWSFAAFSLADPSRIRQLLEDAGFVHPQVVPVVAPSYQGADVDDTVRFLRTSEFAESVFRDVPEHVAEAGWAAVRSALHPYASHDGVFLDAAAWLVTAHVE